MNHEAAVRYAANHAPLPHGVSREDWEQEARIAIWQANPSAPALASTIARRRVIDAVRRARPGSRGGNALPEPISLETPIPADLDEQVTIGDNLRDPVGIDVTRLDVQRAIRLLPKRERFIILAVQAGYSQTELGKMLGVTDSRVSQLLTNARYRMRDLFDVKDAA